jgi:hypothetical protein
LSNSDSHCSHVSRRFPETLQVEDWLFETEEYYYYYYYYYEFELKTLKAFCVAAPWCRVVLQMNTEVPHRETGSHPQNEFDQCHADSISIQEPSCAMMQRDVRLSRLSRAERTNPFNQMLTIGTALLWMKIGLKLTLLIWILCTCEVIICRNG